MVLMKGKYLLFQKKSMKSFRGNIDKNETELLLQIRRK